MLIYAHIFVCLMLGPIRTLQSSTVHKIWLWFKMWPDIILFRNTPPKLERTYLFLIFYSILQATFIFRFVQKSLIHLSWVHTLFQNQYSVLCIYVMNVWSCELYVSYKKVKLDTYFLFYEIQAYIFYILAMKYHHFWMS